MPGTPSASTGRELEQPPPGPTGCARTSGRVHGTRIVEPQHVLRAKPDGDGTIIVFQVFRDLVWPVRFHGPANREQTLYVLNAATGEEHWRSKVPDCVSRAVDRAPRDGRMAP